MSQAASRRALMVINGKSRRGRDSVETAITVLEAAGFVLHRESCQDRGELDETIRRMAGSIDLVVLGGGDGTLNSAAPALVDTGLPFGILPLGTANDLARTLGIPADLRAAAEVIVRGNIRRIDLGDVNGQPFFNVASMGLSVQLTRELTQDVKRRWGRLGYAVATVRALSHMRPFSAEIRHDGEVHRVRTVQISVGNGRHYGGGMTVEEGARVDDGKLDLYSLEFDRLWKLALVYPAFRSGRHGIWKEVRTISTSEVEIRTRRPRPINTDGELTTRTPAVFRVRPKAVAVIAPSAPQPDAAAGLEPEEAARTAGIS